MDRDPLDATQVSHVLDTFDDAASSLDAIASNWARLDDSSPESRLGRAVRCSVELVREPVEAGFGTSPSPPAPGA